MRKLEILEAIQFLLVNQEAVLTDNAGLTLSFGNIPGCAVEHKTLLWNKDPNQPLYIGNYKPKEQMFTISSLGGVLTGFKHAFAAYKLGKTIWSKVSGAIYWDYELEDKDMFRQQDISGEWEILETQSKKKGTCNE